jgi:diaminopimelate epimerase
MKTIYHFSGAGNDFVVIDGREGDVSPFREVARIEALCRQYKTDGLMILGQEMPGQAGHDDCSVMADPDRPSVDFTMEFYNPDGSGGMMCGNGGRCIVAFADYLGIRPTYRPALRQAQGPGSEQDSELVEGPAAYLFRAPDGLHTGEILARPEEGLWEVRIKMIDVQGITPMLGGFFLNTGTRHFVKFVDDVEQVDIDTEGKVLRWNEAFAPVGTNVNFVHIAPDGLHVRTFEKGVEGETLACGTGLTASAIAAYEISRLRPAGSARNDKTPVISTKAEGRVEKSYRLRARQDWLSVSFIPGPDEKFTDVYLTGPARLL